MSRRDVMVVGDLNVSHKRIDHCDPDDVSCFMLLVVFHNNVGPIECCFYSLLKIFKVNRSPEVLQSITLFISSHKTCFILTPYLKISPVRHPFLGYRVHMTSGKPGKRPFLK